MSETPIVDAGEFPVITLQSNSQPMVVSSDLARDLERRLNAAIRERDNAESDRKQADADTIRALHERNEARAECERLKRWTSVNGVAELIAENERMKATICQIKANAVAIQKIRWGYDGDGGSTKLAEFIEEDCDHALATP